MTQLQLDGIIAIIITIRNKPLRFMPDVILIH